MSNLIHRIILQLGYFFPQIRVLFSSFGKRAEEISPLSSSSYMSVYKGKKLNYFKTKLMC